MPLPEIGSKEWEEAVEFMEADLKSGMSLTRMIESTKKGLGDNFYEEFDKWKEEKRKGGDVNACRPE